MATVAEAPAAADFSDGDPVTAEVAPKSKDPLIDIYLQGTPNLRVKMPWSEARQHLGVDGYHVRANPPLRFFFAIGGGLFFGMTQTWYAYVFYGVSASMPLWGGFGMVIGGGLGYMLGSLFIRGRANHIYTVWTSWDAVKKKRTITPMGHLPAASMMGDPSPEHRAAFLARIGELPPRRRPQPGANGHSGDEQPDVDTAATLHIIASYSPTRLYTVLKGTLYRRLLAGNRRTEKLIQIASLSTFAMSVMVIAALIVLVFTDPNNAESVDDDPPGPSTDIPGQEVRR